MMIKMKGVEHRLLSEGKRVSHVSGRLVSLPPEYDYSKLEPNESPLSFTDAVIALLNEGRFIGIDCTPEHYLNKAWENRMVLSRIEREGIKGRSVLNVGGGSCLINSYLASKGAHVVSVDSCERYPELVINENEIAKAFDFDLHAIACDFLDWESDERFDFVFSICVIEHLESRDLQKRFLRQMARNVKDGGMLLLTFGFGPNATTNPYVSEDDVIEYINGNLAEFDIVDPFSFSGLWTISEGHTWGYLAAKKR